MPYRSNRLKIVSNKIEVTSRVSKEIAEAVLRWKHLENRLTSLLEKQDEALSKTPADRLTAESLQADITQLEQDQGLVLSEIAGRPGKNLHDVVAKLEVWKLINAPAENGWSQSSDHLVASALFDLQHKIDNSH